MLYPLVLFLHSWLRWAVLGLGLLALGASLTGWLRGRDWSRADRRLQVLFVAAFDTQLLLGLTLYFALSPFTPAGLEGLRASLAVSALRFFSLEHPVLMLLALTAAHGASGLSRREDRPTAKHRVWAVGLLLALLLILLGIPWPWLTHGRPLTRGF